MPWELEQRKSSREFKYQPNIIESPYFEVMLMNVNLGDEFL